MTGASQTQEKSAGDADGDGVDMTCDKTDITEQSVYAVLSIDNFMLLRTENDYSISVLHQLETAACLLSQQVIILILIYVVTSTC